MARYRLEIPRWQPARLNQLFACGHWAKRYRLKKQDSDTIAVYALQAAIPKATGKRRVTLTLSLGPRQRAPDPDASWKSLLDALVACGLLVDDSPRWLEVAPVHCIRSKERGCIVELEDL